MNHQLLKDARNLLQREKRRAKRKWLFDFLSKCQCKDFKTNPGDAWKTIFKLIGGFQDHHCSFCQKNFKNKKSKVAKNDNENAEILKNHYKEVFTRSVPVDLSVLKGIKQLPLVEEYGAAPSKKEIKIAISSIKNNKAPSLTGLTTNMIKNLPLEGCDLLSDLIWDFWSNEDTDFESWHATKLSNLIKGKGNQQEPQGNNS